MSDSLNKRDLMKRSAVIMLVLIQKLCMKSKCTIETNVQEQKFKCARRSVTGTTPFMTSKSDPPSPFSPQAHQWKINGCQRKAISPPFKKKDVFVP